MSQSRKPLPRATVVPLEAFLAYRAEMRNPRIRFLSYYDMDYLERKAERELRDYASQLIAVAIEMARE